MSLWDSPAQLSAEIDAKDILPQALFLFLHQFTCMDLTVDITSVKLFTNRHLIIIKMSTTVLPMIKNFSQQPNLVGQVSIY